MSTVQVSMPKLMPGGWNVVTTLIFGIVLAIGMNLGAALWAKYLAGFVLKLLPG